MEINMGPFQYIIARLQEPSTWVGLGSFLTGVGVVVAPEYWEAITGVGLAIGGFLAVVMKEGTTPPAE
jgi:hypothetical protein